MQTLVGFMVFMVVWAVLASLAQHDLIPAIFFSGVCGVVLAVIAYWWIR